MRLAMKMWDEMYLSTKHVPLLSFLGAVVTTNTVNTITSVVVINIVNNIWGELEPAPHN